MKEVRIDDLREPRRSPEEQSTYEMALAMQVDLDANGIVAEARRITGLTDFADDTLMDRLAAMVAALEADTGLSGLGRYIVRDRILGLLTARLRFEDFVRRHPEALDVELEPPVIVVGLPRSGTTHLVNLLAADSRFRSMPWWEVIDPTPVLGDGPGRDGLDPRYLRCLATHEITRKVAPLTALMHDRPPWSIEEDCELVDLDLCSYTPSGMPGCPSGATSTSSLTTAVTTRSSVPGAAGAQLSCAARGAGSSRPPSTSNSSVR